MTAHPIKLILSAITLLAASAGVLAQERQPFALPDVRVGDSYSVNIENILRDTYALKLETGSSRSIILWSIADGQLPAGLSLLTDGTVSGITDGGRDENYRLRVRVVDAAVKNEELLLDLTIAVKPGRLRLVKISGPRLVAVQPDNSTTNVDPGTRTNNPSIPDVGVTAKGLNPKPTPSPKTDNEDDNDEDDNRAGPNELSNPFSSLNKRFILGFEQTGAASSDTQGSPFLNLFINTPLSRSNGCDKQDPVRSNPLRGSTPAPTPTPTNTSPCLPPRFSIWGDVRLTSTAQQITTLGGVSANGAGTITEGNLNKLVSAFDFVVGPEIRLKRFHHTDVDLIGGFGAVSPLSPKQSAEIFEVPKSGNSQEEAFYEQYPGARNKQHIAFINPDRDRFLRQYFVGFRFKTFNYETRIEGNSKNEYLLDTFPATFDVTFGQNESVTGGRLHKFVVGLDGFYPLPFPDSKRFLYLFGSAKFKAGGPKSNFTPFILDTPGSSVSITDPTVYIADPTSTNRDTFKIGFGVDLVELFKFAKKEGEDQGKRKAELRSAQSGQPKQK